MCLSILKAQRIDKVKKMDLVLHGMSWNYLELQHPSGISVHLRVSAVRGGFTLLCTSSLVASI